MIPATRIPSSSRPEGRGERTVNPGAAHERPRRAAGRRENAR